MRNTLELQAKITVWAKPAHGVSLVKLRELLEEQNVEILEVDEPGNRLKVVQTGG